MKGFLLGVLLIVHSSLNAQVSVIENFGDKSIDALAVTKDGKFVVVQYTAKDFSGKLKIFDAATGKELKMPNDLFGQDVLHFTCHPSKPVIAVASRYDDKTRVIDLRKQSVISAVKSSSYGFAFNDDRHIGGSESGVITLSDWTSGEQLITLSTKEPYWTPDAIAVNNDGNLLAVSGKTYGLAQVGARIKTYIIDVSRKQSSLIYTSPDSFRIETVKFTKANDLYLFERKQAVYHGTADSVKFHLWQNGDFSKAEHVNLGVITNYSYNSVQKIIGAVRYDKLFVWKARNGTLEEFDVEGFHKHITFPDSSDRMFMAGDKLTSFQVETGKVTHLVEDDTYRYLTKPYIFNEDQIIIANNTYDNNKLVRVKLTERAFNIDTAAHGKKTCHLTATFSDTIVFFNIQHVEQKVIPAEGPCISFDKYQINGVTVANELIHAKGFDDYGFASGARSLAISSDEKYAMVYAIGEGLVLWDIEKRCQLQKFESSKRTKDDFFTVPSFFFSMSMDTERKTLTLYGEEETFHFNVKSGEINEIVARKTRKPDRYKIHSDHGEIRAMADDQESIRVEISGKYNRLILLGERYGSYIRALTFCDKLLAVSFLDGGGENLHLIDLPSGKTVKKIRLDDRIIDLVYLKNRKQLVSQSRNGHIRFWDLETAFETSKGERIPEALNITQTGHRMGIKALHFSLDGKKLVVTDKGDQAIIWDLRSGLHYKPYHVADLEEAAFSSVESNSIVTFGKGIQRLDHADVKKVISPESYGFTLYNPVCNLAVVNKLSTSYQGMIVEIHNAENWEVVTQLELKDLNATPVALSNDGKLLAVKSPKGLADSINIYQINKKTVLASLEYDEIIISATFTDDGSFLLLGTKNAQVHIVNLRTFERKTVSTGCGKTIYKPNGSGGWDPDVEFVINRTEDCWVNTITTHKDLMFVAGQNGIVTVLNYKTQQHVKTLRHYEPPSFFAEKLSGSFFDYTSIDALRVSPDGKLLATGSSLAAVYIWDIESGNMINILKGNIKTVFNAGFSSSGDKIHFEYSGFDLNYMNLKARINPLDTIAHALQLADLGLATVILNECGTSIQNSNLHFSPDKMTYGMLEGSMKTVNVYDCKDHRLKYSCTAKHYEPGFVFRSANEMLLADKDTIYSHDLVSGKVSVWAHVPGYTSPVMTYSQKNKRIYVASYTDIYVFNESGNLLNRYNTPRSNINGITVSEDGKFVAVSEEQSTVLPRTDLYVDIFHESDFKVLDNPLLHHEHISAMAFHPLKPWIVTCALDGIMRLWDYSKQKLLCSFIFSSNGDYIAFTPENYYFSTKRGLDMIAFEWEGDLYSFDQFDVRYNRPDLVLTNIGQATAELIAAYQQAYEQRLKTLQMSAETLQNDFHRPNVPLIGTNIPLNTTEKNLKINVLLVDSLETLDRLYAWVNNVPLSGKEGIDLKRNSNKMNASLSVDLSSGFNKVELAVQNSRGAESLRESFYVTYNPVKPPRPNLYVVGIGVSVYKAGFTLVNCDNDIRALVKSYKQKEGNLFEKVFIDTLINESVLKEGLIGIKKRLKNSAPDDVIVVLYSGHGDYSKDFGYYLFTYDIEIKQIENRGIRYEDLESLVDDIPARKKLLMVNACKSGEFAQQQRLVQMQSLFVDLRRKTGAVVISSSASEEGSFSRVGMNHTAFGDALFKVLEVSTNLTIKQLKEALLKGIRIGDLDRQHPQIRGENLLMDFRIW